MTDVVSLKSMHWIQIHTEQHKNIGTRSSVIQINCMYPSFILI